MKQFRRIAFTCVACRCCCSNWTILGEQAKWHEACHKGKRKTAAAATAIWRIDLGKLFMYSEFITAYSAHKSRAAAQQQQQIELYVLQCQWLPYAATSPALPSCCSPSRPEPTPSCGTVAKAIATVRNGWRRVEEASWGGTVCCVYNAYNCPSLMPLLLLLLLLLLL